VFRRYPERSVLVLGRGAHIIYTGTHSPRSAGGGLGLLR
jgi:hypothetical protein